MLILLRLSVKRFFALSIVARCGVKFIYLSNAINRHWPKGETIIANFLGVEAAEIWPSRYKQNEKKQKE